MKIPSVKSIFKRREKIAPRAVETVYYPPDRDMGRGHEIVGTSFRGLVIFCAIFGILFLVYQSIGLYTSESDYRFYSLSAGFMVFVSAIFASLAALTPINRITKTAIPAAAAASLVGLAATKGNPILLAENAARYLYNSFINCVVGDGYIGMSDYAVGSSYSFSEETLIKWSVILVAAVLSALLCFSVARRTNILVYTLAVVPAIALTFFFNIVKGTLGFAFIVASIAGFISMRIVDARYLGGTEKRIAKKKKRALRRAEAKEERARRKIAALRLKSAADRVYETAIDAEMGARRARAARRSVMSRARAEDAAARDAKREAEKAEKKAAREAKRARRETEKAEKKERRDRILAERKMAPEERARAESVRIAEEKSRRDRIKAEKRGKAAEKRARRLENSRTMRRRRAAGGFAAAAAALITMTAAFIPFAVAKKPFATIEFIERHMKNIREATTDLLVGDSVDLTGDPYGAYEYFNYETIDFSPREYEGTMIFRVEAPTDRTVYLKSRTALGFDTDASKWRFADNDTVLAMKKEFGKNFTSDIITAHAYSYLFPLSSEIPTRFSTIGYEKYGFSVEQVHVLRANGGGRILFMPFLMNPDVGVLEYRTTEKTSYKYTAYYDGIYTSRKFDADDQRGYSSSSYVYDMTREDLSGTFEAESFAIDLVYGLAVRANNGEDTGALLAEYREAAKDSPSFSDLGERILVEMSRSEREDFIEAVELEHKYREYAEGTYTERAESEVVSSLAREVISGAEAEKGSPLTRYETVMAVIKYLTADGGFTYSLTPPGPDPETEAETKPIEYFLTVSKCGYCSHFATAATLMLREAGIPVRFTEGYHVAEFETSGGIGAADRYGMSVRDFDSHTWIEVYFDDVGWVPFETTVSFTEYVEAAPEVTPGEAEDETEPEEETPETETPETGEVKVPTTSARIGLDLEILWMQYKVYIIWAAAALAFALVVWLGIVLFKKRINAIVRHRQERIAAIKTDSHYRNSSTDRRGDAKYLIDSLFLIFRTIGIGPEQGEQLSEFADRLARDYPGLSREDPRVVMECVLKEEYGHGLTFGETSSLATYLEDTIKSVYMGLTRREKIRYRYLKRII